MSELMLDTQRQLRRRAEAQRYTRRSILRSEFMYGRGFQSPGGAETLDAFCQRLTLRPGMRMLEIGSGLGESAFHLAKRYGLHVVGLDVADTMVEISNERRRREGISSVEFVHGDIRTASLDEESFDLVWTRDCVVYITAKPAVWRRVFDCLKPGGQLFVLDFACSKGSLTREFRSYLEDCDYHVQSIEDYADGLSAAGLSVVACEDVTDEFIAGLERGKAMLAHRREEFLREFDRSDYDHLMERWDQKIAFCRAGEWKWGLFVARKA